MQKLEKPVWLKHTKEQAEELVIELAKKGLTSEKIGLVLKDTYGIPSTRVFGIKLAQILKEHKLYSNADIVNTEKKLDRLKKHLSKHIQDKKSKRAFMTREARLNKIK
jgi:small subunit ribosomal protein S15